MISVRPLPSPDELTRFYQGFLFNQPSDAQLERRRRWAKRSATLILRDCRRLAPELPVSRVLDVGGGLGFHSLGLSESGCECTLIDIDSAACEYAARLHEGRFKTQCVDPLVFEGDGLYDFVLVNQVIEHMVRPEALCRRALEWLRPGGLAMFATPNQDTLEYWFRPQLVRKYLPMGDGRGLGRFAGFVRKPWFCCDPPRHLHSFTRKSLEILLGASGYERIRIETEYSTTQYYALPRHREIRFAHPRQSLANLYAQAGIRVLRWLDPGRRRWGGNLLGFARRPLDM